MQIFRSNQYPSWYDKKTIISKFTCVDQDQDVFFLYFRIPGIARITDKKILILLHLLTLCEFTEISFSTKKILKTFITQKNTTNTTTLPKTIFYYLIPVTHNSDPDLSTSEERLKNTYFLFFVSSIDIWQK